MMASLSVLFVVVAPFSLNDKHNDLFPVNIINDSVVSTDMARICDGVFSNKWFWMSCSCFWVFF